MRETTIIGAGIIGCAIGLELARRGAPVRVLDRLGAAGHGSTAASCGIVRRFYSTATMSAVAEESARIWARWREWLGLDAGEPAASFARCGMIFIPTAIDAGLRAGIETMRALGIALELLDRDAFGERFPDLDTRSHAPVRSPGEDSFFEPSGRSIPGAILEPEAGFVISPTQAAGDLRRAAERAGARFQLGRAVTAIRRGSGGEFELELEGDERLESALLVNAAGPHSGQINHLAGAQLPISTRPLRHEVHALPNPLHHAGREDALPIVADIDSGVYLRPAAGGSELMIGSLDPRADEHEWIDDPDRWNEQSTAACYERQVLRAMKRLPALRLGRRRGIGALYDVTPLDWNPILDRTGVPGYYVAIGTSGSSFKTAPVIGALMAELIAACEAGCEPDREPLRITLPSTGFEVDMSFFSRRRAAHTSTRTVLG